MSLSLYRLQPDEPRSWALYPEFERRVIAMNERYGVEAPAEMLKLELRQRWVTTPDLAFYILGIEDGQIVGHISAWVGASWNEPYIYVNQVERDDGASSFRDLWGLVVDSINEWAAHLNGIYEKAQRPERIKTVEFWTWWNPAAWEERLREYCDVKNIRHVLRWNPQSEQNCDAKGNGHGSTDSPGDTRD